MNDLSGFRVSHRNRWLLLKNKTLSFNELLLYEFYIDISGFDYRNKMYGVFEYFPNEIAEIFNRTTETIKNWHDSLSDKHFIILHNKNRHLYKVKFRARYEHLPKMKGQAYDQVKIEKMMNYEDLLRSSHLFVTGEEEKIPEYFSDLSTNQDGIAIRSNKGLYEEEYVDLPQGEVTIEDIFGDDNKKD